MPIFPQKYNQCRHTHEATHVALCPACSLFGAMGWLGRVSFFDGVIQEEKTKNKGPIFIPTLQSPQAHRIARKCLISGTQGTLEGLEGRKFYYHSSKTRGNCPWDYVEYGSIFQAKIQFHNLLPPELGTLFIAMGIQEPSHPILLGGGKTIGFGRVRMELMRMSFVQSITMWNDSCQEFVGTALDQEIKKYKALYYQGWNAAYIDGLKQYRTIVNEAVGQAYK